MFFAMLWFGVNVGYMDRHLQANRYISKHVCMYVCMYVCTCGIYANASWKRTALAGVARSALLT